MKKNLHQLYLTLADYLGPQNWWPADSVTEMLCGMILVQNTNWDSAARSLENLRQVTAFDASVIRRLPSEQLEHLIRPSGFYHAKAKYLRNILTMYQDHFQKLSILPTPDLRFELLKISGIGPETADVLLLYLFDRSAFVADTYARKLFSKLTGQNFTYKQLKLKVEQQTSFSPIEAQEFHALIDEYGKLKDDPLNLSAHFHFAL